MDIGPLHSLCSGQCLLNKESMNTQGDTRLSNNQINKLRKTGVVALLTMIVGLLIAGTMIAFGIPGVTLVLIVTVIAGMAAFLCLFPF